MGFSYENDSQLLHMQDIVHYNELNNQGRGAARHLSAVLPAISSAIGTPISTAIHDNPEQLQHDLGLPNVTSAIVVLIDGLGYWNVVERKGHAPYLRNLLSRNNNDRPISTCFPSTTVAAMGVFGTGTCPGLTGMTGYSQINPATRELSQMIKFTGGLVPEDVQTQPTIFEKLSEQGVRVTTCGMPQFKKSALTRAALRGTLYISGNTAAHRLEAAIKASHMPGLTYLYIRDADKMGHQYGWDDEHWIGVFENIDSQLRTLASRCAPGTLIVITADHGMINSNPSTRIDISEDESLIQGVEQVGGEPRAVALYACEGENPNDIAERWKARLGNRALIMTRDDAVDSGIYGPVSDEVKPYLGDVIAIACDDTTLIDSRTQSDQATRLPSVHGSLTKAELDIPFFVDVL
ncbi:alkaline phosphatase family protein [Alloscardovia theropitheci]